MSTPNIPLLRKAVEWVEWQDTMPEIDREWDQAEFRNATNEHAYRLAYFALLAAGVRSTNRRAQTIGLSQYLEPYCGTSFCVAGYIGQLLNREYATQDKVNGVFVAEYATKQLGLTLDQAEELFDGCNTAADIRRICERIAGEKL
jgi:hypothetical protein